MTKTASEQPSPVKNYGPDPTRPGFFGKLALTIKSVGKIILQSHKCTFACTSTSAIKDNRLIILGNGPSLNDTIANNFEQLLTAPTMAVNFAANSPEFAKLKPRYYVLADPHFFASVNDPNVALLRKNLASVDWKMTLFLPFTARNSDLANGLNNITIEYYNAIGAEGFDWFTRLAYNARRALPRPRNVLIPAIMIGIWMGFREIYVTGADHSWMKTISVDDDNNVVSVQPHFYKEDNKEKERVRKDYMKYPLHQIVYSFFLAFRSYHDIQKYASTRGVEIYNATPDSFIDAFPRRPLYEP